MFDYPTVPDLVDYIYGQAARPVTQRLQRYPLAAKLLHDET